MLKRMRQTLFDKGQFSDCPDLGILSPALAIAVVGHLMKRIIERRRRRRRRKNKTYRLQSLLDVTIQRPGLDGNDLRRGFGVMRKRAAAFRAENAMNGFAGGAFAGPGFGGA